MNEDIYTIKQNSDTRDIIKLSICGITYPDKSYEIIRNFSNTACIEYIESGTGNVHIDNKSFSPCEGDSYFLHSYQKHHYYSDKENPWKKYFINVSGKLIDTLITGYNLKETHYFPGLDIKDELCEIIELVKNATQDCTCEIICILNRIFFKMYDSTKEKSSAPYLAEEMKNYLNLHIQDKFKIENLCKHISRSESQTIKIFKNAFGVTPYAYVLSKKIELAESLLNNTNLSVKQVAYKLSFADEYYFSNMFKNKTGISPSKFRKTNKHL